jgi:hypothetical protein
MAQQAGLSESEPLVFFGNFKSLTRKILADESPLAQVVMLALNFIVLLA